ncbi:uncharacterized protein LOC132261125 [Phlebotomus argentipes]|uniref:uncharacterized protein LOC132261125 n=1 Tax=Phlebotomus argentipes TaxID=94469 RepID=UPI002892B70B|nr:uncharacterized protein LOC132261125 [Phlebotomus argentipes]
MIVGFLLLLATVGTLSVSSRADEAAFCVQCDQKNLEKCSVNTATLPATACSKGVSKCFTKLDDYGLTSRGCLNDLTIADQMLCDSEYSENCVVCNENGCNRDILPDTRLKCHECISTRDPSCAYGKSPRTATYCATHDPDNVCLTLIKSENHIQRLCSRIPAAHCTSNVISCSKCITNGCNSEAVSVTHLKQLEQCPSIPPPQPSPETSTPTTTTSARPSVVPTPTTSKPANGAANILPGSLMAISLIAVFHAVH